MSTEIPTSRETWESQANQDRGSPVVRRGLSERSHVSRDPSDISGRQLCRCQGEELSRQSKCEGQEARGHWVCLRDSQKAREAGEQWQEGSGQGGDGVEGGEREPYGHQYSAVPCGGTFRLLLLPSLSCSKQCC